MGSQTKYNSPPFPPSPPINVLQPKRLNMTADSNSPRRILGSKGQLPSVSQLSNQQLTTLLRNSPLLLVDANNCGGGQNEGQQAISSVTKRAPTTMAKRNARERNRVKQVNQGFQTLRQYIPENYRMKKMSKVDTLRCALDYIRNLERVLEQDDTDAMPLPFSISPTNTSSTSISFSSEEDSELLVQAFSSDFSASPPNNENIIKVEEEEVEGGGPVSDIENNFDQESSSFR